MTPLVVVYVVERLLAEYTVGSSSARSILENFVVHFHIVANPDGWVYSYTRDRQWRKNVSPNYGSRCLGKDLNRQFDIDWCKVGASRDPCSEIYCGRSAMSEVEVQNIAKYVEDNNFLLVIDVHQFGQLMLHSPGRIKRQ